MGEGMCSRLCQDECPDGWSCKQVAGTDPDVVYICVSNHANLCKPCSSSAECKGPGGADDVCVKYGTEGSFCGGQCQAQEDCPWGFACQEAETVDGLLIMQCLNKAGVCPCTDTAIENVLFTPCETTLEGVGTCTGKRVCTASGLTPCDAPMPSAEVCNGLDDDCDGETDEPFVLVDGQPVGLCEDGNECTKDSCKGSACEHVEVSAGECKDGDVCTVGDHCEDGECVGLPVACDDGNPCTDDGCDGLGGCTAAPNTAECDDGDPCTVADQCKNAECVGFDVACGCQADADCLAFEDGDKCNGTLFCDQEKLPWQCRVKPGTEIVCAEPPPGPDAICLAAVCDEAGGGCSFAPAHEGFACDDGEACSVGEHCEKGSCAGGVPILCGDDNLCTDDSCQKGLGCVHLPNSKPCSDGNACTMSDTCAQGQCAAGKPLACDDSNACTTDSCSPATGCVHAPTDEACDDGNACTLKDHCEMGKCVPDATKDCDDGNPCTSDSCMPDVGCVHLSLTIGCSDGNPCTVNDKCSAGKCAAGPLLTCDDANPCTDDKCNSQGLCEHNANNANCDDSNPCTLGDHCNLGKCEHDEWVVCDDSNACTTDACLPDKGGCLFTLHSGPCDDGNLCTTADHCQLGKCTGGPLLVCNDNNPCTEDGCVEKAGCTFAPKSGPCSDGNECTLQDHCKNGWCLSSSSLICDDGNPCTDDSCDPKSGCVNLANSAPCDDDDVCTVGDACKSGICTPGGPLPCDDGNVCTDDSCKLGNGCLHVNNLAACEDGNACTTGDTCAAAACVPGTGVLKCSDANPCTDDGCNPAVGCFFVNNSAPCSDGDACTHPDKCTDGTCKAGPPKVCPDDANTCTLESCSPAAGCVTQKLPSCCGNGIVEPPEKCDDGNQASGDGCQADCTSVGVWAFGEFRPALKCGDFKYNGPDYQQFCFTLKGSTYCTGNNQGAYVACENLANGIRFTYDYPQTWPMRFTKNTPSCLNYHFNYIKNFALAIGYANYEVEQTKTGNHCERTWLDDNGNFQQTSGDGNFTMIFKIRYWN
jgi:cysteine-rich repeat protein